MESQSNSPNKDKPKREDGDDDFLTRTDFLERRMHRHEIYFIFGNPKLKHSDFPPEARDAVNLHNACCDRADELLKLGLPPPDKVKNVDDMDEEHRKLLDRSVQGVHPINIVRRAWYNAQRAQHEQLEV